MKKIIGSLLLLSCCSLYAQDKKIKPTVTGTVGVWYEGYGLNVKPNNALPPLYYQRRPWNQVRLNFSPNISFGNWSLPFNVNLTALPTNFAGPYAGIKNQNFMQYITNPMNTIGINPKYKWAELQLGTQYLKYSELSTGDIGAFGAGFDLKPKTYRIKFFAGQSQRGINFAPGPPLVPGAYRRDHWMFQFGKEEEGKYLVALNFAKGKDKINSVSPQLTGIRPQEGFTFSIITNVFFQKGWYLKTEGAQSHYTSDLNTTVVDSSTSGFKPFITAHTSTVKDYAGMMMIGKKGKNFDIGLGTKYLGAGFQTTGYPFMQPDRFDLTLNTRFNFMKNNKSNVIASVGRRVNNVSNTSIRSQQFIGNINWFTQFSDAFSLNMNYNNFGFQSVGTTLSPYNIKNVANDFSVNPSYSWTNTTMMHSLSFNYSYSRYEEIDAFLLTKTKNNTHTAFFSWVPVYLKKEVNPDFSILFFNNQTPISFPTPNILKTTIATLSTGISFPAAKKKLKLRGQLQYNFEKINAYSPNHNILANCSIDWKLAKKFTWQTTMNANLFRFGNQKAPLTNPGYLESFVRTGFNYSLSSSK
jgi:hypothetical protein